MTKKRIVFFPVFVFFFIIFLGLSVSKVMAAPQDCAIFKKGNLSVSTAIAGFPTNSSCFIAANEVEGIDLPALSTEDGGANTAVLIVDRSITLQSGTTGITTLAVGSLTITDIGSLAVGSTKTAIKTSNGLWVSDTDADGWASSFATGNKFTATVSGARRLGRMKSDTVSDCSDSANSGTNNCYAYSQSAYYAYSQSAYWRYNYSQSAYWRYGYSQSGYWRYSYSQSGYFGAYGCFAAGTRVLMADGSYKEIQNIKSGDMVMSYNFDRKEKVVNVVGKLLIHPTIPNGEKLLLVNGALQITTNHNVWSPSKRQWLRMDSLQVGDTLLSQQGKEITIQSISDLPSENVPVYNLSLPGDEHNYFTEDILVHNIWKN